MNVTPSGLFAAAADSGVDPGQFSRSDRSDRNVVAAQPDSIGSSLDRPKTDALAQIAFVPPELWQDLNLATSHGTTAAAGPKSVADMSLGDKVLATAKSGIASAAKDAGGAVGTFLKDPKNVAMLAAGTGTLLAAQAVPGLDVGVDATLGVVGAAMYASAGPEHRENISKALGNLKDYVSGIGSAKTQADLDKASNDIASFLKTGGKEAAEAIGVVAGAAGAPSKLLGLAEKAKALGGVEGIIAAGSKGAKNVGEALTGGAGAIRNGINDVGKWLDEAGANAGLSHHPAFALPGGGAVRESELGRAGIYESRAQNVTAGTRRNVQAHDAAGGHTIDRHVGKSDTWLKNRLGKEPRLAAASTFTSEAAANRAQGAFVNNNSAQIKKWLADPDGGYTFSKVCDTGKPIGRVLTRAEAASETTTKANFALERDSSKAGWHFLTAYPVK